jgi:hypothetical protein
MTTEKALIFPTPLRQNSNADSRQVANQIAPQKTEPKYQSA